MLFELFSPLSLVQILSLSLSHNSQFQNHMGRLCAGATLFSARFTPGASSNGPSTGALLRNPSTVGKKPAKRSQNPYASTAMPVAAQPMSTRNVPPAKMDDP